MISFLQYLKESKSPLGSDLISKFGRNAVFSSQPTQHLDLASLKAIYKILNKHLFQNKLPTVPIQYASYQAILMERSRRKYKSQPPNNFYGVTLHDELHQVNSREDLLKIDPEEYKFGNFLILLNSSMMNKPEFAFVLATVCHEMAHIYNALFGDFRWILAEAIAKKEDPDDHASGLFRGKIMEANNLGINAVVEVGGLSTEQLKANALAAIAALKESNQKDEVLPDGSIKVSDQLYIIPGHCTPIST